MTVSDGELSYIKPFLTSVRKKALFINYLDERKEWALIQYGEGHWSVNIRNISLVEEF
tara:strand:+ start:3191 stop:3364 length:174 start_codon:yes stop_codon:yes gene_type:complete